MGSGNLLKEILRKKKKTVAELSKECQIPAQTLYSIINRDSNLSFENAIVIAKILDIDYLELIDLDNDNSSWHLKRERDSDDMERYGYIPEYSFDESISYMLDNYTKHTAWILSMLIREYNYEIKYSNGKFNLSNKDKNVLIDRNDLEYVQKKAGEYVKNLLDSITNNELINK